MSAKTPASRTVREDDLNALPGRVEMRIGYSKEIKRFGWLFHRKDYHEDGSISDFYGIELDRERFLELGGVELTVQPVIVTKSDS